MQKLRLLPLSTFVGKSLFPGIFSIKHPHLSVKPLSQDHILINRVVIDGTKRVN